ncbi:MAG: metallophosphoesterase [Acidobacteria bacterium]|nr:metallophosphoesterase [Acidobacteriota bacterium]
MRIVHFADLHLDSRFAWCEASGDVAKNRRESLRATLRDILQLARDERADAIFCGGDLYEAEYVTPDTASFLRESFAAIAPLQFFVAPGNHDYYAAGQCYASTNWSSNVHVFREPRMTRVTLRSGLTLWGAAHNKPAGTANLLSNFRTAGDGVHLALFHGAERGWFDEQGEGKALHAPFDAAEIERSGLHYAFLGHYHKPRDRDRHSYPGNPECLSFGEEGKRGVIVADVGGDGAVNVERIVVARTAVRDLEIDVTGCTSSTDILDRVAERTNGLGGIVRLLVKGEVDREVSIPSRQQIREATDACVEAVLVQSPTIRHAYDLDALAQSELVVKRFVRNVRADPELSPAEQSQVIQVGLRALDGRTDLGGAL